MSENEKTIFYLDLVSERDNSPIKYQEDKRMATDSVYNITLLVTLDIAFKMLVDSKLTVDEFRRYFDEMTRKYDSEEVRVLYQSKLDIYLEQSVNGDTKKETENGNHKASDKEE